MMIMMVMMMMMVMMVMMMMLLTASTALLTPEGNHKTDSLRHDFAILRRRCPSSPS